MTTHPLSALLPTQIAAMDRLFIQHQAEIEKRFGKPLVPSRAYYLLRDATANFTQLGSEAAQKLSAALSALLLDKGLLKAVGPNITAPVEKSAIADLQKDFLSKHVIIGAPGIGRSGGSMPKTEPKPAVDQVSPPVMRTEEDVNLIYSYLHKDGRSIIGGVKYGMYLGESGTTLTSIVEYPESVWQEKLASAKRKQRLDAERDALLNNGRELLNRAKPEQEQKQPLPEMQIEQSPAAVVAMLEPVDGCAVTRNLRQNGIEIKFPDRQSADVTAKLKANGFRYSMRQGLWYAKYSEKLHQWAVDLCGSTESTSNAASIGVPSGNQRLITLATVTSAGRVPQNLLKSEIQAGKLEVATYKRFDSMQEIDEYINKEDMQWETASMSSNNYDIKQLAGGHANTHWTDGITLDNDGQISYRSIKFRYKPTVAGSNYTPEGEIKKINDQREAERADLQATAAKIVDLSPDKYHAPFNRKPQDGNFKIENPLKVEDYIGKEPFRAVGEFDGYRLVGTLEVKNVVTSTMYILGRGGGQGQENREDQFIFKAEAGTATPRFVSSWAKFKVCEDGDVSDFPSWVLPSMPKSVFSTLVDNVRYAVDERRKMNDPKKTPRGIKIHEGKLKDHLAVVNMIKGAWTRYESQHPDALRQVTGQGKEEYDQMIALWRKDLGLSDVAVVDPVKSKIDADLPVAAFLNQYAESIGITRNIGDLIDDKDHEKWNSEILKRRITKEQARDILAFAKKNLIPVPASMEKYLGDDVAYPPVKFKMGDTATYKGKLVNIMNDGQYDTMFKEWVYLAKAASWEDADNIGEHQLSEPGNANPVHAEMESFIQQIAFELE